MAGRILIFLSCLLCAGPFLLLRYQCSISTNPVQFWTGSEERLRQVVKDVPLYNQKMGAAFQRYGLCWLIAAALGAVSPPAGILGIGVLCTLGLYLLYRSYRKTLLKCS